MHSFLIKQTGGIDGIRDEGLLASALNAPLIKSHPFIDGNKRIGIMSMLVFLEMNGIEIVCVDKELIELGLGLANGTVVKDDLLDWILSRI